MACSRCAAHINALSYLYAFVQLRARGETTLSTVAAETDLIRRLVRNKRGLAQAREEVQLLIESAKMQSHTGKQQAATVTDTSHSWDLQQLVWTLTDDHGEALCELEAEAFHWVLVTNEDLSGISQLEIDRFVGSNKVRHNAIDLFFVVLCVCLVVCLHACVYMCKHLLRYTCIRMMYVRV